MESVRRELNQNYNVDDAILDVYKTEDMAIMGVGLPPPELLKENCALFDRATRIRMTFDSMDKGMAHRREVAQNHLFDGGELNVYDQKIANLSAGAPGPDLLAKSAMHFQAATEERIVSSESEELPSHGITWLVDREDDGA